jgi:hypothetical protein
MTPLPVLVALGGVSAGEGRSTAAPVYRVDHVVGGDTVALRNGQRVRLVQIDTPEVFFGTECYGHEASLTTKRLLPFGSRVRLFAEPATDRVDQYGRLLRYVVRVNGALKVNSGLSPLVPRRPTSTTVAEGDTRVSWSSWRDGHGRRSSDYRRRVRRRPTTPTRESRPGRSVVSLGWWEEVQRLA